ncbi:MAG TPA: 2OG-Fe(II) oxygenase [Kiloniellaceae bacterium]|nr:2OG-Fe(II) oxygenase [Kiloniellaceae bacterium]
MRGLQEPWFPDSTALKKKAREAHAAYLGATPFPHAYFDDLFPADLLDKVVDEFPKVGDRVWVKHYHANSRKVVCTDQVYMGPWTRHAFSLLNHQFFVDFLQHLTGIAGLIPDPHLWGGGLHQTDRGGRLEVHADFNRHKQLGLDRRINAIVFLNRDWKKEYGGYLELWNRDMTRLKTTVAPIFNRTLIFSTSGHSFHGHPHPPTCPEDQPRRSLALYYYSNGRPEEEKSNAHSTLYQVRPGQPAPESQKKKKLSAKIRRLFSR